MDWIQITEKSCRMLIPAKASDKILVILDTFYFNLYQRQNDKLNQTVILHWQLKIFATHRHKILPIIYSYFLHIICTNLWEDNYNCLGVCFLQIIPFILLETNPKIRVAGPGSLKTPLARTDRHARQNLVITSNSGE